MNFDSDPSASAEENLNHDRLMQALVLELAAAHDAAPAGPAPPAGAISAVRDRLLERVRESAALGRTLVTVRHGDTPWRSAEPGASARALYDNGITRTRMVALQPGAIWHQRRPCEVLVMKGHLHVSGIEQPLPTESFVLCAADALWAGGGASGALLYVRELYGERSGLPAAEQAWWPTLGTEPVVVPAGEQGWFPFSPGVELKPLHGSGSAVSVFARFAPGASVSAHLHDLDEDCIMLRGDLYLSDLLLREGEYQLAPAGTGHRGLASDAGAVLFFHGAIDDKLRVA